MASSRLPSEVQPVQRVSASFNLAPRDMAFIPSPQGSFADKLIFLSCHRPDWLPEVGKDRVFFMQRLKAALPAFLGQVDAFLIPDKYHDGRFGVRAWQHPEILRILNASDPLRTLAAFLESLLATTPDQEWRGTARNLREILSHSGRGDLLNHYQDARSLALALGDLGRLSTWVGRISSAKAEVHDDSRNRPTIYRIIRRNPLSP